MRVCPKCGHHDPWYWRGSGLVAGVEFCRFSEFKIDYPELANALVQAKNEFGTKNFVFGKDYCYHLTKGMNVERQSFIENPTPRNVWHIPCEGAQTKIRSAAGLNPYWHGKEIKMYTPWDRNQTKLVDWNGKKT